MIDIPLTSEVARRATMRSLDDLLSGLTPERRARVAAKAKRLVRAETLRQLRAAAKKTQQDVATATGISQHNVSRLERRGDMLLSTLQTYVDGLGGRLRLVAEFAERESVELDLSGRPMTSRRQAKRENSRVRRRVGKGA